MARSYDIAEITTSDGGLPEIVRMKINRNFRRVCEIAGVEAPSSLSSQQLTAIDANLEAWWPERRNEVNRYTDSRIEVVERAHDEDVDEINRRIDGLESSVSDADREYIDGGDERTLEAAKEYADSLMGSVWELVYPVGAIYMSTSATSPAELFGGTWERVEGRFLLAASASHAAGSTGGSETHSHFVPVGFDGYSDGDHTGRVFLYGTSSASGSSASSVPYWGSATTVGDGFGVTGDYVISSGDLRYSQTSPSSSMPPWLSVYVWKRTK